LPSPLAISDCPVEGRTIFTDASSTTGKAVAVWRQNNEWMKVSCTDSSASVQYLEAQAVALACKAFANEAINIVSDSRYVVLLVQRMQRPGWPGSTIAQLLYTAITNRMAPLFIAHVAAHQKAEGYFMGNNRADEAAKGLWTVQQAHKLHNFLHVGPAVLARECKISMSQAREVVSACPYCQK
ncbi:POL1 protein, partial [Alectura lathami]|nr:POL1 protein [Alectura lathami]